MTFVLSSAIVGGVPRRTDSRERMIATAAVLLRRQGYAATGWRQVVADSATPWGSQAHHFPGGKQQLASEAIDRSGRQYEHALRAALSSAHPADAVEGWAELAALALEQSGWADGCPVATVALETAHESDELAAACERAFRSWRAALSDSMVDHGLPPADAADLALLVLASMEGALLLARTSHSPEPLRTVGHQLGDLLRQRLN